jgi:hypothetical protein
MHWWRGTNVRGGNNNMRDRRQHAEHRTSDQTTNDDGPPTIRPVVVPEDLPGVLRAAAKVIEAQAAELEQLRRELRALAERLGGGK